MNNIPVILVCYKRPIHTAHVLNALQGHNIQNLIIFSDAPKSPEDVEGVRETRALLENIAWTKPDIIYQQQNQGLARSIVAAANYALKTHDRFILLEDDCVPQQYFFEYMQQCLDRYQYDEKIFGINGYTVTIPEEIRNQYPYDVYFYPRIGSWGWATWKRAWRYYEPDLLKLCAQALSKNIDLTQGGADIPGNIQRFFEGTLKDVWTLNWVVTTYLHNAYYIYPTVSHIENIGCDGTGLHSGKSDAFKTDLATHPPLRFPERIVLDTALINNYNKIFGGPVIATQSKVEQPQKKLKIVHINTHDIAGGAAKVAWRLVDAQRSMGHESIMLVGDQRDTQGYSCSFPKNPDLNNIDEFNRDGMLYYEFLGSHKLVDHPLIRSSDIIHLHNLHGGYFNPYSIIELSRLKPVVWTLHDMQAITGHCAHSFDCEKWMSGCGNCPDLTIYPEIRKDSTRKLWQDKKDIYEASKLNIVVPSQWLGEKVKRSILGKHPLKLIYNGINTTVFKPYDRNELRRELQLPQDAILIGGVAHLGVLGNPWKGGQYTIDAMRHLNEHHNNCFYLNIGGGGKSGEKFIINIPTVKEEAVLARYYSMLDVFLFTSLAENCPLVLLEAMSCGLPVVTFSTGGIPELVRDGIEGCVVPQRDTSALVESLDKLIGNPGLREFYGRNARERIATGFDHNMTAQQYQDLYYDVIARTGEKTEEMKLKTGAPAETAPEPSFPRITLMTPSLNQGKYIEKTIRSVLDQGYPNLEYFVIDGGSTDETVAIINRYADRISWWVSEKDDGQADAINKGLARATGVIFNWLNSDDYLEPGALFKVAETYCKDPAAAAWVGAGNRLHDNGFLHYISYPNGLFREHIINNSNGRCFYQPACFMNTQILRQLGGLRKELHFALDYELYIRLSATAPFVRGEGVWCTALAQPDAKTVKNADALWHEIIQVQREYGLHDAVRNLEMRLATGRFNYVMPQGIREKLTVAIEKGELPNSALEIPFSWEQRVTVCIWGDFTEKRNLATFALLNEMFPVIFQRFEGINIKIFGIGVENSSMLTNPPFYTYGGTTPDQKSIQTSRLCIFPFDKLDGAENIIRSCRLAGIPLVTSPEVAARWQITAGLQGFIAEDPFTFAFQSVLPLLDPGVWGNMSAHMLLSQCGPPGRMAEVGEPGQGRPTSAARQPRIHVFIYTWNKCAELEIALRSLATTAYGNFKLFVLNNGSSDGTEQLLNGLVPALFREYKIINLPVNVGAAAARNWLFADPENREAAYLAYFDDDIEVEPDWLTNLLEALEQHPRAGVVGAKIINATVPKVVQHSGGVLTQAEDWINNVVLFTNVPDQGQFDNISERDYVMGCANLYRRGAMDEVGMFDIQFSPTQFDDVDHHLRMRLKGWQVLFNGRVEVRHHRSSGGAANANHLANRFKLEKKYSVDDAAKIIAAGSSLDFVAKHPWVLDMKG